MAQSTSIKLSDGMKDRLSVLAAHKNRSANALMNEAILQYVEREEAEAEFLAEARRRVAEVKETGRHVSHEDAVDWLQRRARGDKAPPPKAGA